MGRPLDREEFHHYTPSGPGSTYRKSAVVKHGVTSDFHRPTVYGAYTMTGSPGAYKLPDGSSIPTYIDVPNSPSLHEFFASDGVPSWSQYAANSAYEEFRENALGSNASVGAAFAEWKQSLGLIANSATRIATAANALRRRNVPHALEAIVGNVDRGSRRRRNINTLADLWLEYSYGWSPLAQDIKDGIDQLGGDIPKSRAIGTSSASHTDRVTLGDHEWSYSSNVRHSTGGTVNLDNPNTFLLSQLGLVNPISVAWELVPYSFCIDWFADVSSFIDSFTDFVGCRVTDTYSVHVATIKDTGTPFYAGIPGTKAVASGWACKRGESLIRPVPNTNFRANLGNSLHRAANATALVLQSLSGLDRLPARRPRGR